MRFKCRTCKNSFTPNYVEINAANAHAEPAAIMPPSEAVTVGADSASFTPPPAFPQALADDPLSPIGAGGSFAQFTTEAFRRPSAPPQPKSLTQELPTPPISNSLATSPEPGDSVSTSAGTGTAKAKHRRARSAEKVPGQLKPFELILAGGLMLAVIGGVASLVYYLYSQPKEQLTLESGEPPSERTPTAADNSFRIPSAAEQPAPPRPAGLMGAWELRSDDGRYGRLVFRPDGSMTASSSFDNSPVSTYEGNWFVRQADGHLFEIDFDQERGGTEGYRVKIILNSADAFTIVESVRRGLPTYDQQRFVRLSPSKAK